MESNILKMINNISLYGSNEIIRDYVGNNRANNEGNALELFVKDAFFTSIASPFLIIASGGFLLFPI